MADASDLTWCGVAEDGGLLPEPTFHATNELPIASTSRLTAYDNVEESKNNERELRFLEEDEVDDDQDEIDDDDDIPVSYQNALLLNKNCKIRLMEFLGVLDLALHNNLERQREVGEELYKLQNSLPAVATSIATAAKPNFSVFYYPYFKDVRKFSHPPNSDTLRKKENKELDNYIKIPKQWTENNKAKLQDAVREDALRKLLRDPMHKVEKLLIKGKVCQLEEEKHVVMEEMQEVKTEMDLAKRTPDSELFQDRNEEFDWMRISAQSFNEGMSPSSCRLMWKNILHPSINKSKWTKKEDVLLEDLVRKKRRRNWDAVAEELGTNRTAFLCCMRYFQKFTNVSDNRKWTNAEDEKLKNLVRICRIQNCVPWKKVSFFMPGRTKDQCYQRYTLSLRDTIRKGTFTETEDFLIMVGVKVFGLNWGKIASFIPHRSSTQLSGRYNSFLNADFTAWTVEEDRKLLQLVQQHDKDWARISNVFDNKTRTQCRARFCVIYNQYKKNPDDFDLNNLKISQIQKARQEQLKERLDMALSSFLKKQKASREEEKRSGFQTVDLEGSLVTPDGITISIRDLHDFMRSLRRQVSLASENQTMQPVGGGQMPASQLGVHQPTIKIVKTGKNGKTVTFRKNRVGRPTKEVALQKSVLSNKALVNFFRPSWRSSLQGRRNRINETYLSQQCGVARFIIEPLKISQSRMDWSNVNDESLARMNFRDCRVVQSLGDTFSRRLIPGKVSAPGDSPRFNTYSRKPQTPCLVEKSSATLIPPCHPTLVGFRGLLLHLQRLMLLASSKESEKSSHKQKRDTNKVLKEGIYYEKIMEIASNISDEPELNVPNGNEELTKNDADALLFQRFRSLFFLPAIMSLIPPNFALRQNFFNDEGDVSDYNLSASEPLDVSDIIEDAQSKPPAKRIRCVKTKPPKEESDIVEDEKESVSSPPPKKRHVATSSRLQASRN